MVSDRVKMILKSKSDMTDLEIEKLTDKEGWAWIFSQYPRKSKEKLDQICFTGFPSTTKKELQDKAKNAHLEVVTRVTKNLRYLCVGENAGPTKLKEAKEKDVIIMTEKQFQNMVETGELPEE